ncbi:acetyltransferase [Defluviimonas sp. 20V17]|uniref:Acetyltransferase (GNAT) family protein n=1 Tax=Allgaiera indica TaxID=765699 RepID=A0AAN4UPU2_9RHOB|nr:GNAT family N-acetyltransferase [Allgaiera indica]KDB03258.1 acetyltransferase [Defluviimonas sp. 20V17]GHE00542.1 hypothetical protein GCM10008024_12470 [Allgaiera indica]SDW60049.1 Acetyltransferase (GNAT) family protein [Allgaiera indica]
MIRRAATGDEANIRACTEQAYDRYVATIGRKPAPMVADYAAQIAAGDAHVAIDEQGAILGFMVFFQEANYMMLENVAVLPRAAGQGVGRALVEYCEDAARRNGLASVRLYTNGGRL